MLERAPGIGRQIIQIGNAAHDFEHEDRKTQRQSSNCAPREQLAHPRPPAHNRRRLWWVHAPWWRVLIMLWMRMMLVVLVVLVVVLLLVVVLEHAEPRPP